jgi:hypothetical protein
MSSSNVTKLDLPSSPASISLMTAIEDAIEVVATGQLTPFEVLGVLDVVSKSFFEEHLSKTTRALRDAGCDA